MKQKKYFYQVFLDIYLKGADEALGFINISQIPYKKLEALFKSQVTKEKFLFDNSTSYEINEELYLANKELLDKEIPFNFDFNLFEYSVSLSGDEMEKYKKDYYEELPLPFSKLLRW